MGFVFVILSICLCPVSVTALGAAVQKRQLRLEITRNSQLITKREWVNTLFIP